MSEKTDANSEAAAADTAQVVPPPYTAEANTAKVMPPPFEDRIAVAIPDTANGSTPPPEMGDFIQYVPVGVPMTPKDIQFKEQGRIFTAAFYPECVRPGSKPLKKCPEYEPFSCLIQQANFWLTHNPSFRVFACESIERDADFTGKIDICDSVRFESAFGMRINVRGLRLWLYLDENGETAVQQIWYLNVMPRAEGTVSISGQYSTGVTKGVASDVTTLPQFEPMSTTLQQLNQALQFSPLAGKIMTIEQLHVTITNWSGSRMDLDKSFWAEAIDDRRLYITCVRIFYIQGPPTPQKIGLEIFVPQAHTRSGVSRPIYEKFQEVSARAMQWALTNKNVRVTNFQTVRMLQPPMFGIVDLSYGKIAPDPQQTLHVALKNKNIKNVFNVSVAYVIGSGETTKLLNGSISSKIFVPYKIAGIKYESVQVTLSRIAAFMNLSKSRAIGMETIEVFHSPGNEVIKHEDTDVDNIAGRPTNKLVCFRLYFDGLIDEPPADQLPPPPVRQEQKSSVCTIL